MKPPKLGKKYWDVVNTGCALVLSHDGTEDCAHDYKWDCENCPVVIEYERARLQSNAEG